jgi:hypothetical protein
MAKKACEEIHQIQINAIKKSKWLFHESKNREL